MGYHGAITLNFWIETVIIFLLIGNVFNLLGFIATSWAYPANIEVQVEYEGLGLWRYCLQNPDSTALECTELAGDFSLPGWFIAVQTLMAISFMCAVLSFGGILMYACAQICHQKRGILIFTIVNNYIAVLLSLIGIILFGVEVPDATIISATGFTISWCFILCTIATVIFTFVGILVVFELLTLPTVKYVEEDLSEPQPIDGGVMGGAGGVVGPGSNLEIQMSPGDGVTKLTMEDPGVKSISLA